MHIHTHSPTPPSNPFPCSAKAGWPQCPSQGRLERQQPTKFQIILCNNKKLHPKSESGTEDQPNQANRLGDVGQVGIASDGDQMPSLCTSRIQVCRAFDILILIQSVFFYIPNHLFVFSQCESFMDLSPDRAPPRRLPDWWQLLLMVLSPLLMGTLIDRSLYYFSALPEELQMGWCSLVFVCQQPFSPETSDKSELLIPCSR